MNPASPTEEELHAWAYTAGAELPAPDWALELAWQMHRGLLRQCIEYADDVECPNAAFFCELLYQWVEVVARHSDFEIHRATYDGWLDVARGIKRPPIKRWRHKARLILQGKETFDRDEWWTDWSAGGISN